MSKNSELQAPASPTARLWLFARVFVVVPALAALLAVTLVKESSMGRYLRHSVELAANFHLREVLGKDPPLSDRLKILAFDDDTVDAIGAVGAGDLPSHRWIELLQGLQQRRPEIILIDKQFAFGVEEDLLPAFHALSRSDVPIAAGALFHTQTVGERPQLDLGGAEFRHAAPWLPGRDMYVYGPHPSLVDAFHKIGHVSYFDDAYFEPLLRAGERRVLPHLSLYAAPTREIRADGLYIDGKAVPLLEGRTLVNFVAPAQLDVRLLSMGEIFGTLSRGDEVKQVDAGDVVLVLPTGITGNLGDRFDTPLGLMRGGYVLAAEANAVLTNSWIRSLDVLGPAVATAALIGLWLGGTFGSGVMALALLGLTSFISVGGLLLFAFVGLDVPWLLPSLALAGAALGYHAVGIKQGRTRGQVLKQALHRKVSDDKLEMLAKRPDIVSLTPQEQVVTVMFFDLVGFSLVSESRTPQEIFHELKTILNEICDTVYAHGGIVDKILGDGALCIFGYSLEEGGQTAHHADLAIRCALDIQRRVISRNLAAPVGTAIFPVRIGIHSAPAFMGDLGSSGRIELTIIGPGVNFAKRLEEACEPYRIMISAATREILQIAGDPAIADMRQRDVGIKHHHQLFTAYEINAFHQAQEILGRALKQHSLSQGRQREEERFLLSVDRRFPIHFPMGDGYIEDYSRSGMRITVPFYIACGVQTLMAFEPQDCPLFPEFLAHHLTQIQVLIRWGRPLDDKRYALGIQFVGLPHDMRQTLVDILKRQVSAPAAAAS